MNLAAIFDADELSESTGPHLRAMRFRKWAILAALTSLGLELAFVAPKAFSVGFAQVSVPGGVWSTAAVVGLAYATFHYALLTIQLVTRYPTVLRARLFADRDEELQRIEEGVINRRRELQAIADRKRESQAVLVGQRTADAQPFSPGPLAIWDPEMSRVLEQAVTRHLARHDQILEDQELPVAYMLAELAIDLGRFAAPTGLLLMAWWNVYH